VRDLSAATTEPTSGPPATVALKLYVVHGSHPCAAVQKALAIKGLAYDVVEWPPPFHAPMQRLIFGARTVPALKIDNERVSGSRKIMRRLEQLVAEPSLFPSDPERLRAVERAELWGDQVFQPIGRELIWVGFKHSPGALVSYGEHSTIHLPAGAVRAIAPLVARLGSRLNRANDSVARSGLRALPAHLELIDTWIADGTLADPEHPNAADLQIGSTVRLLLTIADARPLIDGRPCADLALRLFPDADGEMPVGSLPIS
jgi:glutathione S-transferase